MTIFEYGTQSAAIVMIQPVGDHDLPTIEEEIEEIKKRTDKEFQLIAVKVDDWNKDLSPWEAPAVFGKEDFGEGAKDTLTEIMNLCQDPNKQYYIGGYSLAGLFSLWAACRTELFSGVAAASPSVWFPDFVTYLKENRIGSRSVYLSLGDREAKTRNPVMATVADCIRNCEKILKEQGVNATLEWNQGNHFKEPQIRMAKAFAWALGNFNLKEQSKMIIRYAGKEDIAAITAVEAACFPPAEAATEEEFIERVSAYGNHFWLMFDNEKLIAFVDGFVTDEADLTDEMYENAAMHNENGAWQMIFGVNTLPDYRKHGYAGELIKRAIEDAKKQGRKGLVLTCKERLVHYYAMFGFEDEGITDKSTHGNVQWHQMRLKF